MATTVAGGNITSGFIDLATYDELEKYLYGGDDSVAYFVRETVKATWFTQVPVALSRTSGQANFNQNWSVTISRSGDYLVYCWLRATWPDVTPANYGYKLLWTRNLMHNLIQEAAITFNDLVAMRFDSYWLDFWTAFTVDASKRNAYNNMVGTNIQGFTVESVINADDLSSPTNPGTTFGRTLNLPLPFFFSRDSGVALPVAALPYNDMRLQFQFRDWTQLLILFNANNLVRSATASDVQNPQNINLTNLAVWANYAIVSNDERQKMGCAGRDILIEQVQTFSPQSFMPASTSTIVNYDIRFSHAVKALYFGCRNQTISSEWSNYSTINVGPNGYRLPGLAADPLSRATLVYESTQRMQMDIDYYSLINPYYHAIAIPDESGYHVYSYALRIEDIDPLGSTNHGKLTNVSWQVQASAPAIDGINGVLVGTSLVQAYFFLCLAQNHNIIRISGGALGFPVL